MRNFSLGNFQNLKMIAELLGHVTKLKAFSSSLDRIFFFFFQELREFQILLDMFYETNIFSEKISPSAHHKFLQISSSLGALGVTPLV